jgi:Leucine-rich repeat (LRR) protein
LIIAEFTSSVVSNNAIEDYELMYRAFLENDGEIDLEEQAQLLDLQEELDLTNEQVSRIEANIQAEFKSK